MSITMRSAYQGFYDEADDLTAPIYKCILVGDVNAGKTTFYERFKSGRYYDPPDEDEEDPNEGRMYSEDGIAECCRMFSFAGFTGKLWDTANLENTNSLGIQYFHGSKGVLLVYDVTDDTSAVGLLKWYDFAEKKRHGDKPTLYFVIGTKNDKTEKKVVSIEAMQNRFQGIPIKNFYEVSSQTGEEFEVCLKDIMATILLREDGIDRIPEPIPANRPKKNCCW